MKRKYRCAASLIGISLLLPSVWLAFYWFAPAVSAQARLPVFESLQDVIVPDESAVQTMDRLEKQLSTLANPPVSNNREVDLRVLGYQPVYRGSLSSEDKTAGPAADYQLSMAFYSASKRICVIDGILYSEGALLPDGGRILSIESRRVLVRNKSREHWISLKAWQKTDMVSEGKGND